MKYAKHMPEKTSPASAPNDQIAILSSPSGRFAFFTAKMRQTIAKMTPIPQSVPNTESKKLSDRVESLQKNVGNWISAQMPLMLLKSTDKEFL